MRVVVTGATGNVGTSVLEALGADASVDEIVGVARRLPGELRMPKTEWVSADVLTSDLEAIFRGADCVIHLAWLIQPSRDKSLLDAVNVQGSERVMKAVAAAEVKSLVVASSVGAYSTGPKDRLVDESWPTDGIDSCYYSREKAAVERLLDRFEADSRETRVVRLRPAIILKPEAAAGIRRLFVGPLLPNFLVRRRLIPIVPDTKRLAFQVVHSRDVGEAYRLAATGEASGAFNIASEPVVDARFLEKLLGARSVQVPPPALRAAASLTWRLHLQPTDPGWVDMGLGTPLLDSSRAERELGWTPERSADRTVGDFLEALREGRGFPTPPLASSTAGPMRIREFTSGVGSRQG